MKIGAVAAVCCVLLLPVSTWAVVFGSVRGVVHDPGHRPVPNAEVSIQAKTSEYVKKLQTDQDGGFEGIGVPAGEYRVTILHPGFESASEDVVVASGSAPVLHFQLVLGTGKEEVTVEEKALATPEDVVTPTTVISRKEIRSTPGADLTNSLNLITDYVPGAWVTHDQLHVRGGHQVTWAIDGVPIPNTNIASNVGPQIDPKDIDYLEAQRGGYSPAYGDRTYGVFNVVPRTGFEGTNEGELYTTIGSFFQTNEQINLGSHTEKFAYYASLNGNRSDYGLETPGPEIQHDRVWGLGGLTSLIYDPNTSNQLRFVGTLRRDDYQIPFDAEQPGLRDVERERDALWNFSWVRTLAPGWMLTTSPFYHFNRANYDGDLMDTPLSATQHRDSQYAGAQIALSAVTARHNAQIGVYGFGQRDSESISILSNDGSGDAVSAAQPATGHMEALFLGDNYQVFSWLTLTGGLRLTHFTGQIAENAADPRAGASVRIPKLGWTLHGFWGRYYQAPPLSTVSGPLLAFAAEDGVGFIPLRGERDQEWQAGLRIPLRGWSVEINTYDQHARNYFDHDSLNGSNVFFPLTIDQARLRGWEYSVRSPRLWNRGEVYVAYAYAHAEAAGAVSGGLTDFAPPENGYFLLDHDQRHTLHAGYNWTLPGGITAGGNYYFGSGFTDGSVDYPAHLQPHSSMDLNLGKQLTERLSVAVTALNVTNRRYLLDNSETFGGTHYADPRQFYVQMRYRFSY